MDRVGIVLVNYNGWEDTIECIESILNADYNEWNIFVVDNSESGEDFRNLQAWAEGNSDHIVKSRFPHLIKSDVSRKISFQVLDKNDPANLKKDLVLIKSERNLGFAHANNIAINVILKSGVDYIWILNNDTVIEKDSLSKLVYSLKENDELDMIGSRLMYYDNPTIIQGMGGYFNTLTCVGSHVGEGQSLDEFDPNKANPDYVIGASMFTRSAFLRKSNGFYEGYFLYFEEMDLILQNNAKFSHNYDAVVYHKEGKSIGTSSKKEVVRSDFSEFWDLRNRLLFAKRNRSFLQMIIVKASFSGVIFNRIVRKEFKKIIPILRLLFTYHKPVEYHLQEKVWMKC